MQQYEVDLEKRSRRTWLIFAESPEEAATKAEARNRGFRATAVDEQDVIGRCEGCSVPLLNPDTSFLQPDEGHWLCGKCSSTEATNQPK